MRGPVLHRFLIAAALVALVGGIYLGAPARNPIGSVAQPGEDPVLSSSHKLHRVDRRRALRLWKLTVKLRLDQSVAPRVFAVLTDFDRQLDQLRVERTALMQTLRAAVANHAGDAHLLALTGRWMAGQARLAKVRDARWTELRPLLSLEQQAQLLVLLPRAEFNAPRPR